MVAASENGQMQIPRANGPGGQGTGGEKFAVRRWFVRIYTGGFDPFVGPVIKVRRLSVSHAGISMALQAITFGIKQLTSGFDKFLMRLRDPDWLWEALAGFG